jgi:hypothetical protein
LASRSTRVLGVFAEVLFSTAVVTV